MLITYNSVSYLRQVKLFTVIFTFISLVPAAKINGAEIIWREGQRRRRCKSTFLALKKCSDDFRRKMVPVQKIKPFEFFKRPYFDRSKFIALVSSDLRMNFPMADKWTGRWVSSSNPAAWWALRPVQITLLILKPIILTGCLVYRNKSVQFHSIFG